MPEKQSGWSQEERDGIKTLLRYALAIFGAVAVTLVIVAIASSLLNGAM